MKKVLLIVAATLALAASKSSAEENYNYNWNGGNYFAKSTGGINAGIITNGNSVTFNLLTDRCDRGNGNASNDDDCDRGIFRSQLQKEATLSTGKNLRYNFSVMDNGASSLGIKGPGINIFEIKPFGRQNHTVPTLVIYFQPNTRELKSNIVLSNERGTKHKEIWRTIGKLNPGFNDFQIETKQSTGRDGYVRIKQNGKTILEHYGTNTYKHSYGLQYWFGPYICCGNAKPGEPGRVMVYKNISGVVDNNVQASVTLPIKVVKPVIKITKRVIESSRWDRSEFTSFVTDVAYNPKSMFNYKDYVTFDVGKFKGSNRFVMGFTGDPAVENKLENPFIYGYKYKNTVVAMAYDNSYYGAKQERNSFLNNAQTSYFILNHTKQVNEKLNFEGTVTYGTATARPERDLVKAHRAHAVGIELGANYLIDRNDAEYVSFGLLHPLRIERGRLEFNNFIADIEPEGREIKLAMSYGKNYNKHINYWTDLSYTSDKDNVNNRNNAVAMIYVRVKG